MKCIHCQSLPSPLLSEYKYSAKSHQIWVALLAHKRPCIKLQLNPINGYGFSLVSVGVRTRALPSPIVLAASLPPTGKLSVLLQTSAVCLFAYWVANFVVPEIILKDLQSDKPSNGDGESPPEDER